MKTANAFQKLPFDQEWVRSIGTLSVRVPELRLEEHDYVRLGNDDPSQLTDECLLQASIPVDWTKPVCVFEAGPRDYKRLKTDATGVSQLTIEINDSSYPDRSLWLQKSCCISCEKPHRRARRFILFVLRGWHGGRHSSIAHVSTQSVRVYHG